MSKNTEIDDNGAKLDQAIVNFRENRRTLLDIQRNTRNAYSHIAKLLKPEIEDLSICMNVKNLTDIVSELGGIEDQQTTDYNLDNEIGFNQIAMENPAIMVFGQVKAGKSTLVNCLLRENVVSQASERCTSRMTRLTYSAVRYVELIDSNGTVLERRNLRKAKIPDKFVKLSDADRVNPDEINKLVKVGCKSKFLENGIDLYDTPGLNEIPILTNLSKSMAKNILPLMIYVIDGRTSVKQSDVADITELKSSHPNLQIIYFITKLDVEDASERKITDPIKNANMKMDLAFKKLQYSNLIPSTFTHWSECNYFQGASLHAIIRYYNNEITEETQFHIHQMGNLQSALRCHLLNHFESKIFDACDTMINFQMDVLTKIIHRSNNLFDLKEENLQQILNMKNFEKEVYSKFKALITDSKETLVHQLTHRFINESSTILNPFDDFKYPSNLNIPNSGIVSDSFIIEKCQKSIMDKLCIGLEAIVKTFIQTELIKKYHDEVDSHVTMRMKNQIKSPSEVSNPYGMCLRRKFMENYPFESSVSISDSQKKNFIEKLKKIILTSIQSFMSMLFGIDSLIKCVDVKDPDWIKKQAKKCLDTCNYYELAEEVCNNLMEDFEGRHLNVNAALKKEEEFMNQTIKISKSIRKQIKQKTQNFTEALMLTLNVMGRYRFQNVEQLNEIGRGAQYTVYRCSWNGEQIAKKTRRLESNELIELAEEVYYSYLFEHPLLLPFIGISITDNIETNSKVVSIYTPLMKSDVHSYLRNNNISIDNRLNIGLRVAEALKYLHGQLIMHRDLKLENILLDEKNNVYLADYGLCKSIALSKHSMVGNVIHMAPEVIKRGKYNSKIDIYSFGILLWYLIEGKGNHPMSAKKFNTGFQVIWAVAENDIRPERLDDISDDVWNFITKCWDKDPAIRPSIDYIIDKMNQIIKSYQNNEL